MKFHFALLGVLCTLALARDEGNKALKAAGTTTNDPWDDRVLPTDMKSDLLRKCIIAANTRKMKYFSIEFPEIGREFMKYEVSRFETGLKPVKWVKEIQSKDIFDCSKASKDYNMFQYNGQTCRMANTTYVDNGSGCFCDDIVGYKKDIVYLNPAVAKPSCVANSDVLVGKNGRVCIGGNQLAVPFDPVQARYSCGCYYDGSDIYYDEQLVDFTAIRNYMRANKYQGEFHVEVMYDTISESYKWRDGAKVNNSYIAVQPQEPVYQAQAVISSSHDYLLVMKNNTELITGSICLVKLN